MSGRGQTGRSPIRPAPNSSSIRAGTAIKEDVAWRRTHNDLTTEDRIGIGNRTGHDTRGGDGTARQFVLRSAAQRLAALGTSRYPAVFQDQCAIADQAALPGRSAEASRLRRRRVDLDAGWIRTAPALQRPERLLRRRTPGRGDPRASSGEKREQGKAQNPHTHSKAQTHGAVGSPPFLSDSLGPWRSPGGLAVLAHLAPVLSAYRVSSALDPWTRSARASSGARRRSGT